MKLTLTTMKLTLTWNEFKQLAYSKIKEAYPNTVDDDTVQFNIESSMGTRGIAELPTEVTFNLELE